MVRNQLHGLILLKQKPPEKKTNPFQHLIKKMRKHLSPSRFVFFLFLLSFFSATGCEHSYPEAKIQASLREICKKEYGIDHIEVKIVGKTIGVYMPLEKLFSTDFEEILARGKVKDLSSLLQISPETLDKVEDVLFSTSRVILSTDKPIDFYVLKATDTQLTGITLILVGYVQDIKRVRFWDISRSEYRKRVYHDMKVNYPIIWKRPVTGVFKDLGKKNTREILDAYFLPGADLESVSPLFYSVILEAQLKDKLSYELLSVRSIAGRANEALVYAKVRENYTPKPQYKDYHFSFPSRFEAEYIFVLTKYLGDYKINRVIPFYYIDETGTLKKVTFPPELQLYENVDKWHEEFELEEIKLEDFLSQQISRRLQPVLTEDERIQNTFTNRRVTFGYVYPDPERKEKGYFSVRINLTLKKHASVNAAAPSSGSLRGGKRGLTAMIDDEEALKDIYYLLDLAMRECVTVIRGYWYENYEYVKLEPLFGVSYIMKKPDLDLYRRKKIDIVELLSRSVAS